MPSTDIRYEPIVAWPGALTPPSLQRHSRFRTSWRSTEADLARELGMIRASDPVLQLAAPIGAFLKRGQNGLRADVTVEHPGVILSFRHPKQGPLSYPSDQYRAWEENARAIALTLEALRKVGLWGVSMNHQQYAGFRQIAAPKPAMSRADAAGLLYRESGMWFDATGINLHLSAAYVDAKRRALAVAHPDKPTGDAGRFHAVQEAIAVLERE